MKLQFSKNLLAATVIASSAVLGMTTPITAHAAEIPITLSMRQLNQRVATVPALSAAKDGDLISLSDDGSITGALWQGTYVFHPAGTKVTLSPMYMRWKDGIVTLTPTPAMVSGQALPGSWDASFVAQTVYTNGLPTADYQSIQTLVTDPSRLDVLRIKDNAWLFSVDANGQYTALVDVFVYQAGSQPIQLGMMTPGGILPAATGSQPVTVSARAVAN
jgi:hypothetical protein